MNKQQTTNNKQQTTNTKHQTTNNKLERSEIPRAQRFGKQTTNNEQQTISKPRTYCFSQSVLSRA
ncbi:MAG: hypothetical protein EOM83_12690 [Clostridia bacterium]|nr:hypothetical protein [Clostridia bacterium]